MAWPACSSSVRSDVAASFSFVLAESEDGLLFLCTVNCLILIFNVRMLPLTIKVRLYWQKHSL